MTTRTRISRRSWLGMTGAVALGTAGLAGCSSSSGAAPAGPAGEGAEEPDQYAGERVDGPELVIWADSARVPAMVEASAAFTRDYQVNIRYQPLAFNDINANFQKAGPSGGGPDLLDGNIDWMGTLNQAGLLAPVELGARAQDFDQRAIEGWTMDETLFGVPYAVESLCVYRNPAVIPEPIANWAEFDALAPELVAAGVEYPLAIDAGNAYLWPGILSAFGGYVFGERDGQVDVEDVGLDSEGGLAAAAWLAGLVESGYVRPGTTDDVALSVYAENKVGLHVSGPWMAPTYVEQGFDFVIDPLPAGPAGPGRPWLSARGFMINRNSEKLALARTFLTQYLADTGPMTAMATKLSMESSWLPTRRADDNELVAALSAAGADAQPIPSAPELASYWEAAGGGLTAILNSQQDSAAAMRNSARRMRNAIEES
ncbi:extracellular solute-binding protein [Streptomyces sp. 3MP-14]|uniref:Extracellular solute-binding protein n=1 Tax=Streptomyces mimosae TaxID=2586635 RepID=A0A5N6AG30_9ACTN|nr:MULTISPECIES: extracellular solute-binding protein [Streptomyces]KAB8166966.1 extracellular solute-binding protein [Streptomyces mimosae]KAB8176907.1 extracellular solute-binding protein [Streptomyces sp. 3MP-14]